MSTSESKPRRFSARGGGALSAVYVRVGALAAALLQISACTLSTPVRTIRLSDLESAPLAPMQRLGHAVVGTSPQVDDMYTPLAPRLGFVRAQTPQDWLALSEAARLHAAPSEYRNGTIIGVVSRSGRPLDGGWPIRIEQVRVTEGAALVTARFESGSYLPDGVSYADLVYVDEPVTVLALEINDVRYYPE
ncbi:MAG: hypothetical protein D6744_09465 [Planctomycetota bacterium]|nr:MAG: hypothetical protein D6744_09465 [Planctomycetota bacterium]